MAESSADIKCSEITGGKFSQQNMIIKMNNERKQMKKTEGLYILFLESKHNILYKF